MHERICILFITNSGVNISLELQILNHEIVEFSCHDFLLLFLVQLLQEKDLILLLTGIQSLKHFCVQPLENNLCILSQNCR
jgi:hypothetical protein